MFRYMPRAGYRAGEKRVDVWLSGVQHGHLVGLAAGWECSLSDAVGRLLMEEVVRRGERGVGPGLRGAAVSGGGGPRSVAPGGGEGAVGVGAAVESRSVTKADLEALVAERLGVADRPVAVFAGRDPLEEIA